MLKFNERMVQDEFIIGLFGCRSIMFGSVWSSSDNKIWVGIGVFFIHPCTAAAFLSDLSALALLLLEPTSDAVVWLSRGESVIGFDMRCASGYWFV